MSSLVGRHVIGKIPVPSFVLFFFRWGRKKKVRWVCKRRAAGVTVHYVLFMLHMYASAHAPLCSGNRPRAYISCALPTQRSHLKDGAASQTCSEQTRLLGAAWPLNPPEGKVKHTHTYMDAHIHTGHLFQILFSENVHHQRATSPNLGWLLSTQKALASMHSDQLKNNGSFFIG